MYCKILYDAIMHNAENLLGPGGIYHGEEGAKRLAREFAAGLLDIENEKERWNELQSSYSVLCVRVYNLRPPISNKDWVKEIKKVLKEDR